MSIIKLIIVAMLWAGTVSFGFIRLLSYDTRPSGVVMAPVVWPADSSIKRNQKLPTLLLFAHPKCACTRASMGELAVLMGRSQAGLDAYVVFYSPSVKPIDWAKTDIWETANSIPGVKVVLDHNGAIFRDFNAATSGETLLYSSTGQLLFGGGITASRGHSGDNAGRQSISEIVAGQSSGSDNTPVFGCHIQRQVVTHGVDN